MQNVILNEMWLTICNKICVCQVRSCRSTGKAICLMWSWPVKVCLLKKVLSLYPDLDCFRPSRRPSERYARVTQLTVSIFVLCVILPWYFIGWSGRLLWSAFSWAVVGAAETRSRDPDLPISLHCGHRSGTLGGQTMLWFNYQLLHSEIAVASLL